ncbi:beta strand repeat-containing protein, partial [Bradyrhizobium sp.]|uniref:beta strand repeat-containing protein n=1 Tax=Bradyrhizobium sp. TaxID=376 RepID=UPI003C73DF7C
MKLLDAQHNDITATLTSQQIAAVAAQLVVTPSPGNNNNGSATWTYGVADTAFNFLTAGETLTLTYDAVVDNNFPALDQVTTAAFTITVNASSSVEWIHPTGGLWSVGSNWSSGTVPTATDDAIIPAQNIAGGSGLYDVIIQIPAVARNLMLNADDTTGGQVTNDSTLTIGEVLTIFNNGVLDNLATVNIGQTTELLDESLLQNSGLIRLGQGGDFEGASSVTNSGTIEIAGGTLNGQVDITNSGGVINVDDGAMLTLSGATIDGGTINDGTVIGTSSPAFGIIDVTGLSSISNASLNDGGVIVANGVTLRLDHDTVNGTTFTDTASGATIQIDDGTVLTLTGATINGGAIDDGTASGTGEPVLFGRIAVTGPSTISNAFLNNGGVTIASAVTLTLSNDTVTGTTFTDAASSAGDSLVQDSSAISGTFAGTIDISGAVTFQNGVEVNSGAMWIATGATLDIENPVTGIGATLNDVYVMNSGTIQVDSSGPGTTIISLVLDGGTTVTGGTLLIHVGFPLNSIEGTVEIGTGGATF